MGKVLKSVSLNEFVQKNSFLRTDGSVLYCKYCSCKVYAEKKHVNQHLATNKHKEQEKKFAANRSSNELLPNLLRNDQPQNNEFYTDLCRTFVECK